MQGINELHNSDQKDPWATNAASQFYHSDVSKLVRFAKWNTFFEFWTPVCYLNWPNL